MDVISVIITLVSVVAAVLQIVLFFKVWSMCNDIKAMRQVQAPESDKKEEDSIFKSGLALVAYIVIICVIVYLIIH